MFDAKIVCTGVNCKPKKQQIQFKSEIHKEAAYPDVTSVSRPYPV